MRYRPFDVTALLILMGIALPLWCFAGICIAGRYGYGPLRPWTQADIDQMAKKAVADFARESRRPKPDTTPSTIWKQ